LKELNANIINNTEIIINTQAVIDIKKIKKVLLKIVSRRWNKN